MCLRQIGVKDYNHFIFLSLTCRLLLINHGMAHHRYEDLSTTYLAWWPTTHQAQPSLLQDLQCAKQACCKHFTEMTLMLSCPLLSNPLWRLSVWLWQLHQPESPLLLPRQHLLYLAS